MVHMTAKMLLLVILFIAFATASFFCIGYKGGLFSWYRAIVLQIAQSKASDFRPANSSAQAIQALQQRPTGAAAEKSLYLNYLDIPKSVIDAFIAVEDRSFWENKGYDSIAILRVIYHCVSTEGKTVNGASTITQQLARLMYLTNEISIERKIKEILYAIAITKKYSKQQILEFYVNNCYFSNGLYGIEAASEAYFGCPIAALSLSQIAYVCAIPNRPTYYDPYVDSRRALPRRDKILRDMRACDSISSDELTTALQESIRTTRDAL